jgi:hypothetical protein
MQYSKNSTDKQKHGVTSAQQGDPVSDSKGAPPSITAPTNSIGIVNILRNGIDSLYLSYQGSINTDIEEQLQSLKQKGQSPDPRVQAQAVYEIGEHLFEVQDKGTGYYPYVLVDNAYRIQLSSSSAKQIPLAYVQVKSDWLISKGVIYCKEELETIIGSLGFIEESENVSRCDLFVDFVCDIDIEAIQIAQWITRAIRHGRYYAGKVFTGFTFGMGGDISARLYNKTEEIKGSGKYHLKKLWMEQGWQEGQIVYRLEFELKNRILKEHEASLVDELLSRSGGVWRYCLLNWLKLTIPSTDDATQSRWPLHPLWDALSQVEWSGSFEGTSMPVRSQRIPSDSYLYVSSLAGITSFMAVKGIYDFNVALEAYAKEARYYHNELGLITGIGFNGYIEEKVLIKARKYNLEVLSDDDCKRKDYAEQYRKESDGE